MSNECGNWCFHTKRSFRNYIPNILITCFVFLRKFEVEDGFKLLFKIPYENISYIAYISKMVSRRIFLKKRKKFLEFHAIFKMVQWVSVGLKMAEIYKPNYKPISCTVFTQKRAGNTNFRIVFNFL